MLPQARWAAPALFIGGISGELDAFVDGKPIGHAAPVREASLTHWTILPLPADAAGKQLALRIRATPDRDAELWGWLAVGSIADLVTSLLVADRAKVLVAVFGISVGALALALWVRRREDKSVLAFALWAMARGATTIAITDVRLLVSDLPGLWGRVLPVGRIVAPLALFALALELFGGGRRYRLLFRGTVLAGLLVAALVLADVERFYDGLWRSLNLIWLVCQVCVFLIAGTAALRGSREARLFLGALAADGAAAIHDSLVAMHALAPAASWTPVGDLLIVMAVGSIALGRITSVYQRLAAHVDELEDRNRRLRDVGSHLTDALKARDEFLSVASHELRTPMTALLLRVQLLRKTMPDEDMEVFERQVQRLEALTSTLLDVTRARSGQLQLEREAVDLGEAAREAASRLRDEAARAGVRIDIDAAAGVVGRWDRLRVAQVATNLLSNAIKYGGGKPVRLRVAREGGLAVLEVRDDGVGIPPSDQERIFERFERAVSPRNYGGLGLGLWISREIATALGGSIRVRSEAGKGSAFRLELPLG